MSSYSQMKSQAVNNRSDEDFLEDMSNESRELFKRALSKAMISEIRKMEEETKDKEIPPPSKRYKIRMNRLFRECVGGSFLPFPEVDNPYERLRSRLVIILKINEFFNRRKKTQTRD